ncbi:MULTISPECIES: DUF2165 domain-containing protein [unclassified Streptomyces]|uniref:DUF2165 domain-containing protein n=1 Tax=unclassified Streptomyces TaxID=2593676 RepID=UPI00088510DE|nr:MULTISPECIES: DUF2165 domain-containing protein [unclassified Streptomyces]PBC86333.1 putative small integral membrane protein [Streptomyces sp. 2321.6]SDQ88274.1 Predicted small integral membrane protein [Streptomyces sp. KS_16]SED70907.1 Predicted small integral membrane protein [Streptomyces sp. 2112.3]SED95131.1 Predicted small integral membrane protein [Streptomyces sp. 2133.1]SNC73214.1 Predicted small integral membrane protein [Streptomyces sp. 2114.4]
MTDRHPTELAPRTGVSRVAGVTGVPLAAAVLTGTVALYISLVAFGNITDFGTNRDFVRHVLAMDTTFKDPDLMWRAVSSQVLQDAAYVAIIAWETVTAVVLLAATALWVVGARRGSIARARRLSTAGLLMMVLLFGVGFLAIGGEWFSMWQSKQWNGLEAATRNLTVAGIALVVVHLPGAAGKQASGE